MSYDWYYYSFARKHADWQKPPRSYFVEYLKNKGQAKRVLDVGCGTADILFYIPKDIEYVGVELSAYALNFAKRQWRGRRNTFFINADACSLPFKDNEFDLVISIYVLEHLRFPKKALAEWLRVLKTGGRLIIAVPNLEFPLSFPSALRHKGKWFKIWFIGLKTMDVFKRMAGVYPFRTIAENFSEKTGRYERSDDDLRYIACAWEIVKFLERLGAKIIIRYDLPPAKGMRAAAVRLIRRLPTFKFCGAPLCAIFEKL